MICNLISQWNSKGLNVAKIHYDLSEICGPTVINEGKEKQKCCHFNKGHTDVHIEERRVFTYDEQVNAKGWESWCFMINTLAMEFPKTS